MNTDVIVYGAQGMGGGGGSVKRTHAKSLGKKVKREGNFTVWSNARFNAVLCSMFSFVKAQQKRYSAHRRRPRKIKCKKRGGVLNSRLLLSK